MNIDIIGKPWEEGFNLEAEKVKQIIECNFGDIKVESIQTLGSGWDNQIWYINHEMVFRFPKHANAANFILNEIRILPYLKHLGINRPVPHWIALEPIDYAFPIYGHQYVPGEGADTFQLDNEARSQLAEPLALFLKHLHHFPLEKAHKIEIVNDSIGMANFDNFFEYTLKLLRYIEKHMNIETVAPYVAYLEENHSTAKSSDLVLGHGDLYARHLLLNDKLHLSGIIDWGHCELMNPAVDLRVVYQFLPKSSHINFWQIYGAVDSDTQVIAKMLAINNAAAIGWYAHQVDDKALIQECLRSLENVKLCL